MRVIVIRHHAEDSAGFIAEAFQARGAELSVHLFPDEGPLPPLDGVDHVVVLGAISSVYDEVHAGWVEPELDWLRGADESGVQAFSIGRHLAVQFHPEVDGEQLGLWLEAGGRREVEEAGQDPDAVHAQTIAEEPAARARADRLVGTALRLARSTSPAGALAQ